jgi:hypothetical protein
MIVLAVRDPAVSGHGEGIGTGQLHRLDVLAVRASPPPGPVRVSAGLATRISVGFVMP